MQAVGDILQSVAESGRTWRLSVAAPHEESVLQAVLSAVRRGFAAATLFGRLRQMEQAVERFEMELGPRLRTVEAATEQEAIRAAVRCLQRGEADLLVKGLVPTGSLIRAALDPESGLRSDRLLSHVAVFDDPVSGRLMILTDAGVNIAPNIHRKVQIVQNAVAVARALGIDQPRVAMLAAVDRLNLPAMRATLEAALVSRIAQSGEIPSAFVEGPFALDNAVSAEAADKKERRGNVAGRADILCAPEIETANVLYKALQCFCHVAFASVVVGARSPIAVPSRVDSAESKLLSIALACLLSP